MTNNAKRRDQAWPAEPAESPELPSKEPATREEPTVAVEIENQIAVWDWALSQASTVGHETAHAFATEYPTHTARPSELAVALDAFRNRVIG